MMQLVSDKEMKEQKDPKTQSSLVSLDDEGMKPRDLGKVLEKP